MNMLLKICLITVFSLCIWNSVSGRHCYYRSLHISSYHENGAVCKRYPKSCNEVPKPCVGTTASHIIDQDGQNGGNAPIQVECDFSTSPPGNVIHHNLEERFHVKGYEVKGSYVAQPTYTVPLTVATGLVDSAFRCTQYFKYECHHSTSTYWRWKNRNGTVIDKFFPGGDPATGGCSCRKTHSCASGGICNCAKNDFVWRADDGILDEKSHLPIVAMQYGDTGNFREEGYSTIGPLKCFFEITPTSQIVAELVAVGKILKNHQSKRVFLKYGTCLSVCFQDPNCQSFSTYKDEDGNSVCETSSCDGRSSLLTEETGFYYLVLFRY